MNIYLLVYIIISYIIGLPLSVFLFKSKRDTMWKVPAAIVWMLSPFSVAISILVFILAVPIHYMSNLYEYFGVNLE